MKYSGMVKRAQAYILDYLIVSIPIMIITYVTIYTLFSKTSSITIYPFILMMLIYCPYFILGYLMVYPIKSDIVLVLASIVIIIALEAIIYTIMEVFGDGQTIGKKIFKIRLKECSILKRFFRNILKSSSKYLLCVPYFFVLITPKKQAGYDLLLGTHVVEN